MVKTDKEITSQVYHYSYDGYRFVANISVITFNKIDNYTIYIIQTCPENLYNSRYKKVFKKALESVTYNF